MPATLKSAFLEPVSARLAPELCVDMFGRTDADFMAMFTGGAGGRWGRERLVRGSAWGRGRVGLASVTAPLFGAGWTRCFIERSAHCSPPPHCCHPAPAAAAGVLAALEAKRDALAKRTEGLLRAKQEFSELARCL